MPQKSKKAFVTGKKIIDPDSNLKTVGKIQKHPMKYDLSHVPSSTLRIDYITTPAFAFLHYAQKIEGRKKKSIMTIE